MDGGASFDVICGRPRKSWPVADPAMLACQPGLLSPYLRGSPRKNVIGSVSRTISGPALLPTILSGLRGAAPEMLLENSLVGDARGGRYGV